MSIKTHLTTLHEQARPFATGFVLGSAFMASPALGAVLAVVALIYIAARYRHDQCHPNGG